MLLLLLSVMTGGQYLLTSTVEEIQPSRRGAPLCRLGDGADGGEDTGSTVRGSSGSCLYAGLGIAALFSFAMFGLLDPALLFFLIVFYLMAYFTIASFMAAIGSAVNEMREAQTLMTPVMLAITIPWILWLPISREPNSVLAVVLASFRL